MGVFSGEDAMVESFSARFEANGGAFIFRPNLNTAPVRVSVAERDEEVRRFRRSVRWVLGSFVVITVAALLALMTLYIVYELGDPSWTTWLVLLPLFVGAGVATAYVYKAPDRRFAQRCPVAPKLGLDEIRRRTFEHISWGTLAIVPLVTLVILIPRRGEQIFDLSFNIKIGIVGIVMVVAAVQAFRKWRFERNKR